MAGEITPGEAGDLAGPELPGSVATEASPAPLEAATDRSELNEAGPQRRRRRGRLWLRGVLGLLLLPALLWLALLGLLAVKPVQRELLRRAGIGSGLQAEWRMVGALPGRSVVLHGVRASGPGWTWTSRRMEFDLGWRSLLRGRGLEIDALGLADARLELILEEWAPPPTTPSAWTQAAVLGARNGGEAGRPRAVPPGPGLAQAGGPGPAKPWSPGVPPGPAGGSAAGATAGMAANLAAPERADTVWAAFLRRLRVDGMDLVLRQRRGGEELLALRRLRMEPAAASARQQLDWQRVELLGAECLPGGSAGLVWNGASAELHERLATRLGAPLQVDAAALLLAPATLPAELRLGWRGTPGAGWQVWLDRLGCGLRAEDFSGQVEARAILATSGGRQAGEAELRLAQLGWRGMPVLDMGVVELRGETGGCRAPLAIARFAEGRGWLLGNGVLRLDGGVVSVLRFVSGADFGLGWCDPRARRGQWIAGFRPMADPGMWYRDVVVAGPWRSPSANLLDERQLLPLGGQLPAWLERLQSEGAPLGPWLGRQAATGGPAGASALPAGAGGETVPAAAAQP